MPDYTRSISDKDRVEKNKTMLRLLGVSEEQVEIFSLRRFEALPRWIRQRIKRAANTNTWQSPAKLEPREGERGFYMKVKPS